MRWVPRITYDSGTTFELQRAQLPWTPRSSGVGGARRTASGLGESFLVRRDQEVRVTLLFFETEWAAVRTWLEWAMDNYGTAFTFQFDKAGASTAHQVTLAEPRLGATTTLEPERADFPGLFQVSVVLRSADGSAIDVQVFSPLFVYTPGLATSSTFVRASVASYVDQNGVVQEAASGELRDAHFVRDPKSGLLVRSTLLEDARTNLLLHSEAFDNVAWLKSPEITVTADQKVAPDGTTTADKIANASAVANRSINQSLGAASAARYAIQLAIMAGSYSKASIGIRDTTAATWPPQTMRIASGPGSITPGSPALISGLSTTEWTVIEVVLDAAATAGNTLAWFCYPDSTNNATTGDLYLWGAQAELGDWASSYVRTTTAAAAREADVIEFPFPHRPQAMTVYVRFVETGSAIAQPDYRVIACFGSGGARLLIYSPQVIPRYSVLHSPAVVFSSAAVTPAQGQLVELRAVLFGDGSVQLGQALDGGVEAIAARTAAGDFAEAWTGNILTVGHEASHSHGFAALRSLAAVKGVRSLAQMRAVAGAS